MRDAMRGEIQTFSIVRNLCTTTYVHNYVCTHVIHTQTDGWMAGRTDGGTYVRNHGQRDKQTNCVKHHG